MHSILAVQELAERRRQCIVRRRGRQIQSVTARGRHVQCQEGRRSHTIDLIAHVRVPLDAANVVLDLGVNSTRHKVAIYGEQRRVVFDVATHLVHMQAAKVLAVRKLPVRANVGKVLIVKDDNTALGCEQCKLIKLGGCQSAQLQRLAIGATTDFGANGRRDLRKRGAAVDEKRLLGWVGPQADIVVDKLFQGRLLDERIVRQVGIVFVLDY